LLLDLHNIFTNSLNGASQSKITLSNCRLSESGKSILPAGSSWTASTWTPIQVRFPMHYSVTERLIPRLPSLRAMIFEIFPSFVSLVGLEVVHEQLRRLRKLWQLRGASEVGANLKPTTRHQASLGLQSVMVEPAPPEAWERALGQLVVGRRPEQDNVLSRQLAEDPGVRLVEGLVHEFRASMIVGVLRLTSRLLMLALGPEAFRVILSDYWAATTPKYATLEAEAFASHLEKLNLRVPHLPQLLAFERAVTMTLTDGKTRVVRFDFEPIPLLRALADGRLPDEVPQAGSSRSR
jgi:hypothetical protein